MILIKTEIINDTDTYHAYKVFGAEKLLTVTASEYMKYFEFSRGPSPPIFAFLI